MDIFKAVKMERSSFKKFIIFMIAIAIILPLAMLLADVKNIFYLVYLGIIEGLIFISIIIKLNYYKVDFKCLNNKLTFKMGILTKRQSILCNRVVLVHTNKYDYDLEIVIISYSNLSNRSLRKIDDNFFMKYPTIKEQFEKIEHLNPEKKYYFQIIKRGGLRKYLLLDCIYRNCVEATYSEECINNIKIARGQTIV